MDGKQVLAAITGISSGTKRVLLVCGTVLFVALFIWPTPYRYVTVTVEGPALIFSGKFLKERRVVIYKVNRFFGWSSKVKTKPEYFKRHRSFDDNE